MDERKITRREFLRRAGFGALGFALLSKPSLAQAAPVKPMFGDNMAGSAGAYQGETPPANQKLLWLNTGSEWQDGGGFRLSAPGHLPAAKMAFGCP